MGLTPDAVVLVIDHSGSMETHIDAETDLGPGVGETRLAFAQAASRDFVDLLVNRAGRVAGAGLVSFDSAATLNQAIAEVIRGGTPGAGQVTLDSFKGVVNTLAPGGRTAIGLGLKQAGDMLAATTFSAKTIVLLSDGENNEPTPLGDADPLSVATNLGKQGVRIFTVPTGKAADKMLLGNIAAVANGTMFEAPIGDELPSIYAEAFALSNGETLTVPRTSVTVANTTPCMEREIQLCNVGNQIESNFGCICKVAGEIPIKTQLFDVEEGATQLNIFLSARNIDVDAWDPSFALIDPSGTLRLTDASPGIASDRFYRLVTLANPEPGRWQLEIAAVGNDEPQIQYLQVHVAGEGPDCYPRLSRIVVSDTESEVLSVDTSYAGRAIQGVSTFVDLYRPDGSMVSLAIEGSDSSGVKFAAIDPSLYVGRGIYRAETYCTTSEQSTYVLGEGATGPEPGDEGNRPLPFARRASKSFFVDSDAYPPLPPGGDCDRNGIPDSAEPTGDFDGDGLPDVCDQDDDNDDAPEPGDPDPRSSTCHFTSCPVANAGPDQTIECSSPDGTAIATLNATASSDPDGQALTYAWASSVPLQDSNLAMATGTFPLGTREAKLTVSDGTNEVSDTTLITVIDTTPPSLHLKPLASIVWV